MREILSRGKRTDNGEWVYGDILQYWTAGKIHIVPLDPCRGGIEVFLETVGQYTGLTDTNGTKIFEDDILQYDKELFVVTFGKCGGVKNCENYGYIGFYLTGYNKLAKDLIERYGMRDDILYYKNAKVIGNIHDNPEMLEVGE